MNFEKSTNSLESENNRLLDYLLNNTFLVIC